MVQCAVVKNPPVNAGDTGSVPGLVRSHMLQGNWAHEPQRLKPTGLRACALRQEKPRQWVARAPQLEGRLYLLGLEEALL